MLTREIGFATAALCVGASAIVLPPPTARHRTSADDGARPTIIGSKRQRIEILCPSCAFISHDNEINDRTPGSREDWFWTQGGAQTIGLDFSISSDGLRLQLDEEAIYPLNTYLAAAVGGLPIYVTQTPAQVSHLAAFSRESQRKSLEVTSWDLVASSSPVISSLDDERREDKPDRLTRVTLQIRSLENQSVDLAEVAVDLLETNTGEHIILDVEQLRVPISNPSASRPAPACAALPGPFCKAKHTLSAAWTGLRNTNLIPRPPCSGKTRLQVPNPELSGSSSYARAQSQYGQSRHWRPSDSYRYGHRRPEVLSKLTRGLIAILIPVMAGITAGLLISLVGLLVGRLIGYIWISVARLARSRDGAIRLSEEGREVWEKDVEPLPLYEDAPAYEEAPAYEDVERYEGTVGEAKRECRGMS